LQLYSIYVRKPDNNADSDRGKKRGLNSPFGRRGAICAHFGWTWDYLHNGIAWGVVQRMMMDAPSYDYDKEKPDGKDNIELSKENAKSIANHINSMM
jgi:hypothetical protein